MAGKRIVILVIVVGVTIGFLTILNKEKASNLKTEEEIKQKTQRIKKPEVGKEIVEIKEPEVSEKRKKDKEKLSREKAPDFVLEGISGKKVGLSDYKGKVMILDFWDTWCNPCKIEIPGFVKLQEEWGNKGLQIVGIAFARQGVNAVRAFAKSYKINYPVGICDEQTLNSYGPIRGIPTTFILDKEGRIYKKYIGYRPEEIFVEDIKNLISE